MTDVVCIFNTVVISYLKAQKTGSKQLQFLNPTPEKKHGKVHFSYSNSITVCVIFGINQKSDHFDYHFVNLNSLP